MGFSCKKWHKFIRSRGNEIPNCHTSMRSWVAKHTKGSSHVLLSYLVCSQIWLNFLLDNRHFHYIAKLKFKKKTLPKNSQTYNYFDVVEEGHCSHIKSFEVGHLTFSSNRLRLGSSSSEMDGGWTGNIFPLGSSSMTITVVSLVSVFYYQPSKGHSEPASTSAPWRMDPSTSIYLPSNHLFSYLPTFQ